jgi:hypothetical protein
MDPSAAFQQQHQQPQRSSSNVSLSSLVRTGSGGGGARGRGGATRGRRMVRRVCRGVITFIFAIGTAHALSCNCFLVSFPSPSLSSLLLPSNHAPQTISA